MHRLALLHSWWVGMCSFLVVSALDTGLDTLTHSIVGDVLGIVFMGVYGAYCLQNFLACREIHCAFTSPGLLVLRAVGLAHWQVDVPYLVAFVTAVVGCGLEWAYASRTSSHFLLRT